VEALCGYRGEKWGPGFGLLAHVSLPIGAG
jgi:hypothetical protein